MLQCPQLAATACGGTATTAWPTRSPSQARPGTHRLGDLDLFGVDVAEKDLYPSGGKGQPDAGTDKPGTDDADPLRQPGLDGAVPGRTLPGDGDRKIDHHEVDPMADCCLTVP